MIPLRSEKRSGTLPVAVWLIAASCLATMLRLTLLPDDRALAIIDALAVVPARLLSSPVNAGQVLTLFTSTFLHAGWMHLFFNLLYLLVFGPLVQARLGWKYFALLYMASGAVGALTFALVNPASTSPLLGASGAIAGILGAHLVLEPRARITTIVPIFVVFEVASLPAAFVIAVWFALQVASTFAPVAAGATDAGIAWIAHIGGFLTGMALASPAALRTAWGRRRRRRRASDKRNVDHR